MTQPQFEVLIEDIPVQAYANQQDLFDSIITVAQQSKRALIGYANVHVLNTAFHHTAVKLFLQQARFVYCDGAGVGLASQLLSGRTMPRFAAADWFTEMLEAFTQAKLTVYMLGSQPGVSNRFVDFLNQTGVNHSVVGAHHGYLLKNSQAEADVIAEINALKPNILIIGMGTPVQEDWILRNRQRLDVNVIYPLGAVMDYYTGQEKRCPAWMGQTGWEWLYRLMQKPRHMFGRYVIGNPWFFSRILTQATFRGLQNIIKPVFRPVLPG